MAENRRRYEEELLVCCNGQPRWTRRRIQEVIDILELFEQKPQLHVRRTSNDYFYAKTYEIIQKSGQKYLALKRKSKSDRLIQVLAFEDYYDVLSEIHRKTGHVGRDKTMRTAKKTYTLPVWAVNSFLKMCMTCQNKKGCKKTKLIESP